MKGRGGLQKSHNATHRGKGLEIKLKSSYDW